MANIFTRISKSTRSKAEKNKVPIICTILIILLVFVFFFDRIVITIHSGEAGVLYKRFFGGTVVDKVYGEGIHVIPPWDKMYIYNVRVQEAKHQMEVLSSEGLRFHIDLSVRYHPEYEFLGYLHKRVGPEYIRKIIIPEIESVMRTLVGKYTPEEVYTTKRGLLNKSLFSAFSQLSQKFIILDDVIIRDVILPDTIRNAIEQKLKVDQLLKEYKYLIKVEEKEKERKKIEAEGIRKYQQIVTESLTNKLLEWQGINSTLKLAESKNAKIVVIGRGKDGLPLILDMKQDVVEEPTNKDSLEEKGTKAQASDETLTYDLKEEAINLKETSAKQLLNQNETTK